MKKTLAIIALAAFMHSCKKHDVEPEIIPPINDNSLPSAAITATTLENKSGATIEFSVDVVVFRDSRNIEGQLKEQNFLADTLRSGSLNYFMALRNAALKNGNSVSPYSALMLMDQSGSITSTDPRNFRLEAATAFCSNLGNGDKVALWSFQGSDATNLTNGFSSDTANLLKLIRELKGKETGSTPLYKSQNIAINYVTTNATNNNKALMTFTDGADNNSAGITSQTVIDNAVAKNTKLFNIGLDQAETAVLTLQALSTNGAFMYAADARQLISMFGNLGKLLNKSANYYHTTWKITRSSGTFTSGTFSHHITIKLPYGGTIAVPFTLKY